MSCSIPLKNYVNSRYLTKDYPFRCSIQFPCGFCSDCIRRKKSEYRLRSYYEAKDLLTKSADNFVLFDTLTYRDSHLKYFHDVWKPALYNAWDFMSFSRSDIDRFFDLLRKRLFRGFDLRIPFHLKRGKERVLHKRFKRIHVSDPYPKSEGNLRYLLTSEYGSTEGCTHRPHYHVLFFVGFKIDPLLLSRLISYCWPHGRTDGIPYKSKNYILYQRVSRGLGSCIKLANYVTKYITKDLYVYRKLLRRVYYSFSIHNPNWQESYSKRLEFRRFKSQVLPFHRQSLGFGLSALFLETGQWIDDHQSIRMPVGSKGILASIPLCQYYRRKLYFEKRKYGNFEYWIPNDRYRRVFKSNYVRNLKNLSQKLVDFDKTLCDRARSVASYMLLRRGLFGKVKDFALNDLALIDRIIDGKQQPHHLLLCNNRCWFNYNTSHDGFNDGFRFTGKYVSDIQHIPKMDHYPFKVRCWSHSEFVKNPPFGYHYIFNKEYEDIIDRFNHDSFVKGLCDNLKMYQEDRQRFRYKQLGFLNS